MKKYLVLLAIAFATLFLSRFLLSHDQKRLRDRAKTTFTTWNVPPASLPKERQIWDETVSRFEAAYSTYSVIGFEREYLPAEFISVMAGGKGPDLVKVSAGAIPTLAARGFLAPLDKFVSSWDQKDFIEPVYWNSVQTSGGIYGVPADTQFLFLLYRKDLFQKAGLDPEAPPKDWQELLLAAKTLTRRDEGRYGLGLIPRTWYFQDFVWQAGGEMARLDAEGKIASAFGEAPAVQALQFWKDLRWKYDVLQPDPLMRETELLHLFALGKVAMIFGTSDQLPALLTRYGLPPEAFGIAPMPSGPSGPAAHLSGQVYVLNAGSSPERMKAAWEFIRFELSPANQLWKWRRVQELGMFILPGSFSPAAKFENLPGFRMVQGVQQTARVEPHAEGWPQVQEMLDARPLQEVLLDPDADPERLLVSYAREADRMYLQHRQEATRGAR
jgi:ABC-type glycerol-3-phosphate transport system substrate-binding protein